MLLQKTISMMVAVGLILALSAMFAPTANAAGDEQSTMIRHGRFVWHKPITLTAKATAEPTKSGKANGIVYDKGELGVYKRDGRVVEKVNNVPARATSDARQYATSRHKVSNDFKRSAS